MPEVFKRTALNFGGAFAANRGLITFGTNSVQTLTAMLVQGLGIDFQQQVTRVYELADGTTPVSVYDVGGRTQGSMAMGRIIGSGSLFEQFYNIFGNICLAPTNVINLRVAPGCETPHALEYKLRYCLLTRVGLNVQAQDLLFNENTQLIFNVLEYNEPFTVLPEPLPIPPPVPPPVLAPIQVPPIP